MYCDVLYTLWRDIMWCAEWHAWNVAICCGVLWRNDICCYRLLYAVPYWACSDMTWRDVTGCVLTCCDVTWRDMLQSFVTWLFPSPGSSPAQTNVTSSSPRWMSSIMSLPSGTAIGCTALHCTALHCGKLYSFVGLCVETIWSNKGKSHGDQWYSNRPILYKTYIRNTKNSDEPSNKQIKWTG